MYPVHGAALLERVERLIGEQIRSTLGNEGKAAAKRRAKIDKFRNTFRDKAFKSGKFKAATEYAQQRARFDAMPERWKMRSSAKNGSRNGTARGNCV